MRKDLINFLFDNMEYMQQYEKIKIYYDNGQQSIVNAIHKAMEYSLSKMRPYTDTQNNHSIV